MKQLPQNTQDGMILARVPPKSIEMEEAIIGTLLLNARWLNELNGILTHESFYEHKYSVIYERLVKLDKEGYLLELPFITQKLMDFGIVSNKIGDNSKALITTFELTMLTQKCIFNIGEFIQASLLIAEKHMRRNGIQAAISFMSNCYDETEDILDKIAEHDKVIKAIQGSVDKKSDYMPSMWIMNAMTHIESGMLKKGLNGIPTGIKKIDGLTGGFQNQNVITIGARARIGKSAVAIYMAYSMALNKIPVVYVTMEMSAKEIGFRIFSIISGIPYSDIQRGNLDPSKWEMLNRVIGNLSSIPLYIDDTGGISPEKLRAKVYKYHRDHNIKAVFVDYVQQMQLNGKETMAEKLSSAMQSIKSQAKMFDIPFIVLSQVDRMIEKGGTVRHPTISDLKGSGGIEESSDVVICLHRPDEYDDNPVDANGHSLKGIMEFYIEKNKQGETGLIRVPLDIKTNRFLNDMEGRHNAYTAFIDGYDGGGSPPF